MAVIAVGIQAFADGLEVNGRRQVIVNILPDPAAIALAGRAGGKVHKQRPHTGIAEFLPLYIKYLPLEAPEAAVKHRPSTFVLLWT